MYSSNVVKKGLYCLASVLVLASASRAQINVQKVVGEQFDRLHIIYYYCNSPLLLRDAQSTFFKEFDAICNKFRSESLRLSNNSSGATDKIISDFAMLASLLKANVVSFKERPNSALITDVQSDIFDFRISVQDSLTRETYNSIYKFTRPATRIWMLRDGLVGVVPSPVIDAARVMESYGSEFRAGDEILEIAHSGRRIQVKSWKTILDHINANKPLYLNLTVKRDARIIQLKAPVSK